MVPIPRIGAAYTCGFGTIFINHAGNGAVPHDSKSHFIGCNHDFVGDPFVL